MKKLFFLSLPALFILAVCTATAASKTEVSTPKIETNTPKTKITAQVSDSATLNPDELAPCNVYVEGGHEPLQTGDKVIHCTQSSLFKPMPKFEVETWLTEKPDFKNKHLLITYWNTWCPPCRRFLPISSKFQDRFKNELVVIDICDEPVDTVKTFLASRPKYNIAVGIDTQARMKKELGVFGVPHTILVEPAENVIIWEGFPLQGGFELTEEKIDKLIQVWRNEQAKKK